METPAYIRWWTQLPGILCLFSNGQVCPQNVFVLRWSRPCQNLRSASEWTTQAVALRSKGPVTTAEHFLWWDGSSASLCKRGDFYHSHMELLHHATEPDTATDDKAISALFTATICHIDSDVGFAVSGSQYPLFGVHFLSVAWKCGANFPSVIAIEVGHAGPKLPPLLIPKPVNQFNKEYQTPHPLH